MAKLSTSAYFDASSYATFAAWANFIGSAFTTFGWTQTTDYGQVNWTNLAASNTFPDGTSAVQGTWTPGESAASVTAISASGGVLTVTTTATTGYVAGRSILLTGLTSSAATYNGFMFTITGAGNGTQFLCACPASFSFSGAGYTSQSASATLQPAFMIFKSGDSLTGTLPIYVKMEFAGYKQAANIFSPWIRYTIGTSGTNGYGTLSSPTTASVSGSSYMAGQQDTTNDCPLFVSGDSSSFRLLWLPTSASTEASYRAFWFVLTRSKDNNGNNTANYYMHWNALNPASGTATYYYQAVFASSTNIQDETGYFIAALPKFATAGSQGSNNSGAFAGVTMVSPLFQNVGGLSNPTPDIFVGSQFDFPGGTMTTITVYGVAHNYLATNYPSNLLFNAGPNSSNMVALIRME